MIWPQALKSYRESVVIRDRLANADPGNTERQRKLSMAYDRIDDVLNGQGSLGEPLKSYRDSLVIRERPAEVNPA